MRKTNSLTHSLTHLFIYLAILCLVPIGMTAQNAENFEKRMSNYINNYAEAASQHFQEQKSKILNNGEELSETAAEAMILDQAKHQFIRKNIKEYDNNSDYAIYDLRGQVIKTGKLEKGVNQIELVSPSGIYFLKTISAQGIEGYQKFIK